MRDLQIPLINLNSMKFENRIVLWPRKNSIEIILIEWFLDRPAMIESEFNFTFNSLVLLTKLTRVLFFSCTIHFIRYAVSELSCSIEIYFQFNFTNWIRIGDGFQLIKTVEKKRFAEMRWES